MGRFGELKYAVLVKSKDLEDPTNTVGETEIRSHRGTGFVQFKDPQVAVQVMGLSQQIEGKLDEECKQMRVQ